MYVSVSVSIHTCIHVHVAYVCTVCVWPPYHQPTTTVYQVSSNKYTLFIYTLFIVVLYTLPMVTILSDVSVSLV